jgi:hypothetical protein
MRIVTLRSGAFGEEDDVLAEVGPRRVEAHGAADVFDVADAVGVVVERVLLPVGDLVAVERLGGE